MRAAITLAACLALSACGGGTSQDDTRPKVQNYQLTGPGMEDPEPAPEQTEAESLPEATVTYDIDIEQFRSAIPANFHGVWDYEGGTCARESDMRMEISASEILFYESIGAVSGVEMEGADAVVSLDMEGEGETWTQKTRLSLSGEGDDERLATSDGEQPKVKDEYPSKRCPA